jgi:hypothetical protein
MAQVEVDFQGYRLKQEESLLVRGAVSRPERDNAALDYDMARLHVAVSRARQALLVVEHVSKPVVPIVDPAVVQRLKTEYLQARVQYYEIGASIAKTRLEMAREQLRRRQFSQGDMEYYQKAYDTASEQLKIERERLADPDAALPTSLPRAG